MSPEAARSARQLIEVTEHHQQASFAVRLRRNSGTMALRALGAVAQRALPDDAGQPDAQREAARGLPRGPV